MKHYVVDEAGHIREFDKAESGMVAAGLKTLPDYADSKQRYLQVNVVPKNGQAKVEVHMAAAWLEFDKDGRLMNALMDEADDELDPFLRETCAELALRSESIQPPSLH